MKVFLAHQSPKHGRRAAPGTSILEPAPVVHHHSCWLIAHTAKLEHRCYPVDARIGHTVETFTGGDRTGLELSLVLSN